MVKRKVVSFALQSLLKLVRGICNNDQLKVTNVLSDYVWLSNGLILPTKLDHEKIKTQKTMKRNKYRKESGLILRLIGYRAK